MDTINFGFNGGGYPLTQNTLARMQTSYLDGLNALCETFGAAVGSRYLILSNNLCWFDGQFANYQIGVGTHVRIVEQRTSAIFQDGEVRDMYVSKRLEFGNIGVLWTDFVRVAELATKAHGHTVDGITGLQAELNNKAASSHTHTIANVTNLQSELNGESGTWSPTGGGAFRTECIWHRVGRRVFISGYITLTTRSDEYRFGGLPRVPNKLQYIYGISYSPNNDIATVVHVNTSSQIIFSLSDFNSGALIFSGSYEIN
jgi:hypothetical protein